MSCAVGIPVTRLAIDPPPHLASIVWNLYNLKTEFLLMILLTRELIDGLCLSG